MNPTTMCGQCAYGIYCAVSVIVGAWIISVFSYVSPLADAMSERGCPAEQSDWVVC